MVYVVNSVLAIGVDIILEEVFVCFTSRDGNSSIDAPNPNSFNDPPNVFTNPPQPQYESYSCELCGNDAHYGYDCPPRELLVYEQEPCYNQNFGDNYYLQNSPSFSQQYICFTVVLLTMEPEDSLIMGDEKLSTIPEKESDEFIKYSVEDLVPVPSESKDTFGSDSECDLPLCDDFSPINIPEGKSVTFSNHLFDSNEDFTSSDNESLSDEDVLKDKVKIYSNPLFEFDDEYISSDVNPLFDKVLENIESKNSYVSNLDEPPLLVTPLSDANEDECFNLGGKIDEIDAFLDMDISTDIENGYHDLEGDIIYLESLLIKDNIPNLHPEDFPNYEDSRALGFVHRSLDLQSLACLYMGIQYPRSY
ncbi:hypothetical protein Tco_0576146 [Tanacetum coccineum]